MSSRLGQQEVRRGRLQGWLQTAAFLGAAAILGMVIYTSAIVQSNRRTDEAAATAAVRTQTALVAVPTPTVQATLPGADWQLFASTPLPAALQPIHANSAARLEEVARWGRGVLNTVAWAPDGSIVVAGTTIGVYLYDPQTGREEGALHLGSVVQLAFSPDGELLAVVLAGGQTQLWSIADGTLLQTVEGGGSPYTAVGFSLEGKLLLLWAEPGGTAPVLWVDGMAISLPLPGKGALETLDNAVGGQSTAVNPAAVAFSPDGRFAAVGMADGHVYLWHVPDGSPLTTIPAGGSLDSLAFSPNGRLLATASAQEGVQVWQTDVGTPLHMLERGIAGPLSLAFSPNGRTLVVAGRGIMRLYGMDTGALVRWVDFSRDMATASLAPFRGARAAFSPDGEVLVLGTVVDRLLFFSVGDGALLQSRPGFVLPWSSLALSPDGRTLAVRSFVDRSIWLWDVARAMPRGTLPVEGDHWYAGAFSPDGRLLAVGQGAEVVLWQVADGAVVGRLSAHTEAPNPAALPAGAPAPVVTFTIAYSYTAEGVYPTSAWVEDPIRCTAFAPDERWVAATTSRGRVFLWQVWTGELRWTGAASPTVNSALCSLSFSPGGQYLTASWLNSAVYLWRIPDGALLRRWEAPQGGMSGETVFSPDGRFLAAWTAAGEVSLWSVTGRDAPRTLAAPLEIGLALAFSPDGSVLAGASAEGQIYLWSVGDGTLLRTLEGHTDWINGLAFSPDERLLFSASGDGTVRAWGVR